MISTKNLTSSTGDPKQFTFKPYESKNSTNNDLSSHKNLLRLLSMIQLLYTWMRQHSDITPDRARLSPTRTNLLTSPLMPTVFLQWLSSEPSATASISHFITLLTPQTKLISKSLCERWARLWLISIQNLTSSSTTTRPITLKTYNNYWLQVSTSYSFPAIAPASTRLSGSGDTANESGDRLLASSPRRSGPASNLRHLSCIFWRRSQRRLWRVYWVPTDPTWQRFSKRVIKSEVRFLRI